MDDFAYKLKDEGGVTTVDFGDDSALFVEFFRLTSRDEEASQREGRAIHTGMDAIRIRKRGDRSYELVRPVSDEDKFRFARQWDAYANRSQYEAKGTPLKEWPMIEREQVEELAYLHIFTVEDLVAVPDGRLNWLGARALQESARKWLDKAKNSVKYDHLEAENAALKAQMEELRQQVQMLAGQAPKAKRGRKAKLNGENAA